MQTQSDANSLNLVHRLCVDPQANTILNTTPDEEAKEATLIHYLLTTGLINMDSLRESTSLLLESYRTKYSAKSRNKANEAVGEGNHHFEMGQYAVALSHYSKSLMWLPLESADDFHCLLRVWLRQKLCLDHMAQPEQALFAIVQCLQLDQIFAKTHFKANEIEEAKRLPKRRILSCRTFVQESLEMKFKPDLLRHKSKVTLVATRPIAKGNIVVAEKPFTLVHSNSITYCANCDLPVALTFYPCHYCNEVRFCDKICFEEVAQGYSKVHRHECGVVGLLLNSPIYLQMLRFYLKTDLTPLFAFQEKTNYLHQMMNLFQKANNLDTASEYKSLVLNAFRQSMDQIAINFKEHFYKPMYYGLMQEAIEFCAIYDYCLENGRENKKLAVNQDTPHLSGVPEVKSFGWLYGATIQEAIVSVFRDLKRFSACPFVYSYLPWAEHRVNNHFPSLTPPFSSLVTFDKSSFNLAHKITPHLGLIELFATQNIQPGDELILQLVEQTHNYSQNYLSLINKLKSSF